MRLQDIITIFGIVLHKVVFLENLVNQMSEAHILILTRVLTIKQMKIKSLRHGA